MKTIAENIYQLKEEVANAAIKAGRDPKEINIVAVSKRHPVEVILEACNSGITAIGENRVLEAFDKFKTLNMPEIKWHMIGHLQKNKVSKAAKFFDVIHSLDSFQLGELLNNQLKQNNRTIKAFLQPKLSFEETKTGLSIGELEEIAWKINKLSNITLIGLMGMPPFTEDPENSAPYFEKLRKTLDLLNTSVFKENKLLHLSMGMTHDFKVAIQEGATYIRVGTKIFGERV